MSKLKPVFDIAVTQYHSSAIHSDELTAYFCGVVNVLKALNIPDFKYLELLKAYIGIDGALDEQISEFLPITEPEKENYLFKIPHNSTLFAYVCVYEEDDNNVYFEINGKGYSAKSHYVSTGATFFFARIEPRGTFTYKSGSNDHHTLTRSKHIKVNHKTIHTFAYYSVVTTGTDYKTVKLNAGNRKLFEHLKQHVRVINGESHLFLKSTCCTWRGYDGEFDSVERDGGWIWDDLKLFEVGITTNTCGSCSVYRVYPSK